MKDTHISAHHSVGLPTASLTVRHGGGIIASHCILHQQLTKVWEHLKKEQGTGKAEKDIDSYKELKIKMRDESSKVFTSAKDCLQCSRLTTRQEDFQVKV